MARSISAAPRTRPALATVCAVLFLTFLDTTIVSVTLGDIQSDLGAGVIPLQWVVNGYALVFASLMLTGGSLGDRLGRKWVMLSGIVVFCIGSVLCAVASTVTALIVGRCVLGSAVLTHVRAFDSGMAASATNTSRQIGAVVGVTALVPKRAVVAETELNAEAVA